MSSRFWSFGSLISPHASRSTLHACRFWSVASLTIGVTAALYGAVGLCAEPAGKATAESKSENTPTVAKQPEAAGVAAARERAKLMHEIYSSTLDRLHHHYFHGNDRAAVPARVMQDVFDEMAEKSKIESRWIAVNTRAMSIDHKAETPFEQKAAAHLSDGKTEFEMVENGYYQRAGVIPLTDGCLGCHTGLSRSASSLPRFAGLVIRIPLEKK